MYRTVRSEVHIPAETEIHIAVRKQGYPYSRPVIECVVVERIATVKCHAGFRVIKKRHLAVTGIDNALNFNHSPSGFNITFKPRGSMPQPVLTAAYQRAQNSGLNP